MFGMAFNSDGMGKEVNNVDIMKVVMARLIYHESLSYIVVAKKRGV